jgi:hypothetical protein
VVVVFDPLEFKVDKVCGIERTGLLQFHRLHGGGEAVEIGVGTQTSCPGTDQVEPHVRVFGLGWCSRVTTCRGKQLTRIRGEHRPAVSEGALTPERTNVVLNIDMVRRGTEGSGGWVRLTKHRLLW